MQSKKQYARRLRSRPVPNLIAACILAVSVVSISPTAWSENVHDQQNPPDLNLPVDQPRIQLAILLDTSNSMDGLIDQTRNQLWQVVNEFSTAKQNGFTPILEIALYEYGNDNNAKSDGYLRRINAFTEELDAVSESLFSLTTKGGDEYSGYAIQAAVNRLQWSQVDSDIKTIFIAGNESFQQGPVNFRKAIKRASELGISVNTIHAGEHQQGIGDGWQSAALLAGGEYMSIDADRKVVHIDAPQDVEIAKLNERLNETYVPYGKQGVEKVQRQKQQDQQSSNISAGLLAKRVKSKSSALYKNSKWDLVDALNDGEVSEQTLADIDDEQLPQPLKNLTVEQKINYVKEKGKARKEINQAISELSEARADFVAKARREQVDSSSDVGSAMTQAIQKQAAKKNFSFDSSPKTN